MARLQTMVQLTDQLLELLDDEARRRGVSRSAVIREVLAGHFEEAREAAIGRSIVDGYTRVPQATPDEWGEVDAQAERSTLETLQRLDAEETAGGHGPW